MLTIVNTLITCAEKLKTLSGRFARLNQRLHFHLLPLLNECSFSMIPACPGFTVSCFHT